MRTRHRTDIGWGTNAAKPLAPQAMAAKRPMGGQRVPSAGVGSVEALEGFARHWQAQPRLRIHSPLHPEGEKL